MRIIPRTEWGFDGWRDGTPSTVPTRERSTFFVHYEGESPVGSQTGPSVPRSIHRFHKQGRKWAGIGYNFVVDQNGTVFEGRGWDLQGAHCPGYNRSGWGVQIHIGGKEQPSAKALSAAVELYAEACRRAGRSLARKGHRDGISTSCPGEPLYAWVKSGMPTPATGKVVAIEVEGRIGERWREMGGPNSILGNVVGQEVKTSTGAWRQFERGFMLWSPATDARVSLGKIRECYAVHGLEHGLLGYPTSDEIQLPIEKGGVMQEYQGGMIYYHPATGPHAVYGAIYGKWAEMGWVEGALGFPESDEFDGLKPGRVQNFQGGTLYWSPVTGSWPVWGVIKRAYGEAGYEGGRYGYPTGPERFVNGAWEQPFEGGILRLSDQALAAPQVAWLLSEGARDGELPIIRNALTDLERKGLTINRSVVGPSLDKNDIANLLDYWIFNMDRDPASFPGGLTFEITEHLMQDPVPVLDLHWWNLGNRRDVKLGELALFKLGFLNWGEWLYDGVRGDATTAAIKRFQQSLGNTPDGELGPNQWRTLGEKSGLFQANPQMFAAAPRSTPAPAGGVNPCPGAPITAVYGQRPKNRSYWQAKGFHTGRDYGGGYGAPLHAVVSGTVTARDDGVLGCVAILRGDNGRFYWYCHTKRGSRVVGRVTAGQKIAEAWDTGTGAKGPHLHLEDSASGTTWGVGLRDPRWN